MVRPSMKHDACPEAYGEAMVRCQGYPPACSQHGECLADNWCFRSDATGLKKARKTIEDAILAEGDIYARGWLKGALDALDDKRFSVPRRNERS